MLRAYYATPGRTRPRWCAACWRGSRRSSAANAWIAVTDDDVLFAAAADLTAALARSGHDRPPLWGIPIAVKDNVDVRGLPTTAGCPDYAYEPAESAELVRRLLEAGRAHRRQDQHGPVRVGADRRAQSPTASVRSPFDPAYIGGGSSSGSAPAVALGLASAAIGTDTAGSGRVPAALHEHGRPQAQPRTGQQPRASCRPADRLTARASSRCRWPMRRPSWP